MMRPKKSNATGRAHLPLGLQMKMELPEIRVFVHGWPPYTGAQVELAMVSMDEYTIGNLQRAVSDAVSMVDQSVGGAELPLLRPQLSVWLRSERGVCARMRLSADLIRRISAAGASIDFDPMYDGMEYLRSEMTDARVAPPEVSAFVLGSDPGSGAEKVIARSTCGVYSFENVELLIYAMLKDACVEVGELLPRWNPRVLLQPALRRDDRASMHFTSDVIRKIAEAGASLEFDPSVYVDVEDQSRLLDGC